MNKKIHRAERAAVAIVTRGSKNHQPFSQKEKTK